MSPAPRTSHLLVPGPVGDLEALIDEPPVDGSFTQAALICHPHPLFGGSMTNKVVHILARTFNELGAPSVRFNFRGVGKSAGTHDDGGGEIDDTLAMLRWIEQRWPGIDVWLAGFSFGAAMALHASLRHPVHRLITVAPALRWLAEANGRTPKSPWLIVQGDRDELVSSEEVQRWAANLPSPPTLKILPGAEHFFHGRLNDLRDAVKEWLTATNGRMR
jgi:uncharacterized protein